MMGLYYTNFFLCNITVGRLGGLLESMRGADFWLLHAAIVGAAAALLALFAVTARALLAPVDEAPVRSGAIKTVTGSLTPV
jgi:POT family proton-dependent oligopeptide transporter